MQKVDRLGWAVGLALKAYGVRIGIRTNDREALAGILDLLPGEWEKAELPIVDRLYSILNGGTGSKTNLRRFNLLYGDHIRLARSMDREIVFDAFQSDLRIFLAEFARHRVFVHAGVVGWKGRAIVVPGRSYSGKSTLVAELVRAGASYYSDEYAVFDGRGRVHPFSKPIELREEGQYKQSKVELTELGGHPGTKPLTVGLVVMTQYRDGARWRPRRLSAGQAVLEMLFNTVSARRNPERALATLERVTAKASVWKGVRGHATDVVPAMLRRMEESSDR
jgi:hypothetical protein